MKTNPDDYAYPQEELKHCDDQAEHHRKMGLTKLEYFAAHAMQGLLSAVYSDENMLRNFTNIKYVERPRGVGKSEWITGCEAISSNAVSYAKALIEELNNED